MVARELARAERRRPGAERGGVEEEDGERGRDRQRDHEARGISATGHAESLRSVRAGLGRRTDRRRGARAAAARGAVPRPRVTADRPARRGLGQHRLHRRRRVGLPLPAARGRAPGLPARDRVPAAARAAPAVRDPRARAHRRALGGVPLAVLRRAHAAGRRARATRRRPTARRSPSSSRASCGRSTATKPCRPSGARCRRTGRGAPTWRSASRTSSTSSPSSTRSGTRRSTCGR